MFWIPLETPARSAFRKVEPAIVRPAPSISAREMLLDPLAGVADLLHRLLHGGCRAAGLLGLVTNFVLLPAGNLRPVLVPTACGLLRSFLRCSHHGSSSLNDVVATSQGFTGSGTIPLAPP